MSGESAVFQWLRAGVPLSLLLDLASPPDSREVAAHEAAHEAGRRAVS